MSAERPNVLLLLSDEHSFRCLGSRDREQGGEPVMTPALDGLAAASTAFDATYCSMPLCTPSRLCMLTGREAHRAGAWSNWSHLPPDLPTLPQVLGNAGYETALVGKMHLGGTRQFAGFDHRPYGDLTGETGHQYDPPTAAADRGMAMRSRTEDAGLTGIPESLLQERNVLEESLSWLREHHHRRPGQPWFLCASFSRPHFPLTAPRRHVDAYWPDGVTEPVVGYEGDTTEHPLTLGAKNGFRTGEISQSERQRARAAYFACVSYLDEVIGDLLASLAREGFLEDTIVTYTSDHGELAGEHGLWWKHTWHEASTRVPWFVQLPAHRSGGLEPAQVDTPVSLVDLFPTVCGLVDAPTPPGIDGVDLSEILRQGDEPDRGPVVTDNFTPRWGSGTEFRMVRDGPYKYVRFRDAPEILIDLENDPLEQTNLAAGEGARSELNRLRKQVDAAIDFEQLEADRRAAEVELETRYRLGTPKGTGNAYLLPDGRIVEADTPLYRPHVLMEEPGAILEDFPEAARSEEPD